MKESRKSIEGSISLVASIISIFQFIVTLPTIILGSPLVDYQRALGNSVLPLKIVIVLMLEVAISYFVSILYRKTEERYFPVGRYILIIFLISAISVWTSIFNFQQIFFEGVITNRNILYIFLVALGSNVLSGFFVMLEMEKPLIVLILRTITYMVVILSFFYV